MRFFSYYYEMDVLESVIERFIYRFTHNYIMRHRLKHSDIGSRSNPALTRFRTKEKLMTHRRARKLNRKARGITEEITSRVFVLDTCYLIRLAQSGYGVYRSLEELADKGEIIITEQVFEEFKKHSTRETMGELCRAIFHSGVVKKERIEVTPERQEELSSLMGILSEKNNSRLAAGDSSIIVLTEILGDLYDRTIVLSDDSDVHLLIPRKNGVSVERVA